MYVILYTLALAVFQGIEYLTCDVFMGGHPMTILNLDIFVLMFQAVITEVRRTSLIHPPPFYFLRVTGNAAFCNVD